MSSASSDKVLFDRNEAASTHDEIWDDTALIRIYEETKQRTYKAMQKDGAAGSSKDATGEGKAPKTWKQGDLCMAPYEDGKWYEAKILSIDEKVKKCKVNYTEYGEETADVELDRLLTEDDVKYEEAQEGADAEEGEESMESESASVSKADSGTDRQSKDRFPIPAVCPPPPPGLFGKIPKAASQNEALTNMLMSWYMSGYHTGYYQGMADAKASKPPRNGQK
ncbi:SMN-1 protein [Aphelenchoides avenae]|nr:SMN-1 protein [Aphelenchus avenae]